MCEEDPFTNVISLTPLYLVKSVLFGWLLVPVRVLLFLLTFLFSWVTAHLIMVGMDKTLALEPLTGCRQVARRWWFYSTGYLIYWSMGFRVKIVGERAPRNKAPILIVAPHTSFLDISVVMLCQASPVARIENMKTPFLGCLLYTSDAADE